MNSNNSAKKIISEGKSLSKLIPLFLEASSFNRKTAAWLKNLFFADRVRYISNLRTLLYAKYLTKTDQ